MNEWRLWQFKNWHVDGTEEEWEEKSVKYGLEILSLLGSKYSEFAGYKSDTYDYDSWLEAVERDEFLTEPLIRIGKVIILTLANEGDFSTIYFLIKIYGGKIFRDELREKRDKFIKEFNEKRKIK